MCAVRTLHIYATAGLAQINIRRKPNAKLNHWIYTAVSGNISLANGGQFNQHNRSPSLCSERMNYTKSQDVSGRYGNAVRCWVHICIENSPGLSHRRTRAVVLAQLGRRFRAKAVGWLLNKHTRNFLQVRRQFWAYVKVRRWQTVALYQQHSCKE